MVLVDYVIVGFFLILIFLIGTFFYRWVGKPEDMFVAGRQLTPFILAATITATNVNLYSFVGQAGIAYKHGLPIIWQTWTGNMALVFSGLFIIPILRRLRISTVPEFLERRYNRTVRALVAFLWVFRLAFWLGVVLYTAAIAAQSITGIHNYSLWIFVFSFIVIIYTMLGGMWSIAILDTVNFTIMLTGALILLPVSMSAIGWWPGLVAKLPPDHLRLITQEGLYNWKFILAITLLGIQWASLDQGLLQRSFGSRNPKTAARALVMAGIITTPFALLWIIPGMVSRVLHPGLSNQDMAFPTLLTSQLGPIILGFVVCGLLASQISTIDSNLNAAATLFTNDIYKRVFRRKATDREVLRTMRLMTVLIGVFMILFSYAVPILGGAVNAYLTVIGIMDMPLFIVAVVYGLFWKRASWKGAIWGYLSGALAGSIAKFGFGFDFNVATFFSAGVALLVTPIASLLTRPTETAKIEDIWQAKKLSEEELQSNNVYHIIPISPGGRISLVILLIGFMVFITGILMGSKALAYSSAIALAGMVVYFAAGLTRLFFD